MDARLSFALLFNKLPMPDFGPDLSGIRLKMSSYYQKLSGELAQMTFPKRQKGPLIVWESPRRKSTPSGAVAQYESEVVYHNMKEEFEKLELFTDTDTQFKSIQS